MKNLLTVISILFIIVTGLIAQDIPITLYFTPPYEGFDSIRVAGTINGWNNNDPAWTMHDDDGDGIYQVTNPMTIGVTQDYKFVFDADWSQAFNDPNNPIIHIEDNNNSRITPTDPNITYLLPRDINSLGEVYVDTSDAGEPIRAILAFTDGNEIDPSSIVLTINGTVYDNVADFYNDTTQIFSFTPPMPFGEGEHTVIFEVSSTAGTTIDTTTFERLPGFAEVFYPIEFYYDEHNSRYNINQNINNVSVMGEFNGWNNVYDPMQDDDLDGLWEATVLIKPGQYEYKFQANDGFWMNDFDLVNITSDGNLNNIYDVEADTLPRVILKTPKQGTVYKTNNSFEVFDMLAVLRAGVGSEGVDETSIAVFVDGFDELFDYDTTTTELTTTSAFGGPGTHELVISFSTKEGKTVESKYTFALVSPDDGFAAVDAFEDEVYTYPTGVETGSGDLKYLNISTSNPYDSLTFSIELENISDRTRLGIVFTNPTTLLAPDSRNLELDLPDWQSEGIFFTISPPGNPYFNADIENRFQVTNNPASFSEESIFVNGDAVSSNKFEFNLSVEYLENIMGTWFDPRDLIIFSYIADTDGSGNAMEITSAENGDDDEIDADIYDAFFIRDAFWQNRMLNNYITSSQPFGPMETALDGPGRGITSLAGEMISDSLAVNGPRITILTPSVNFWYSNVTVHGEINDSSITSANFYFNGNMETINVTDGHFSKDITLDEGINEVHVIATDTAGYTANSKTVRLTYTPDKMPYVYINTSLNDRTVTLTADAESPVNSNLTYNWIADENNPSQVTINGSGETVTVDFPANAVGEYFISCEVEDAEGRTYKARRLVNCSEEMVNIIEDNEHADWIERAIIYEIFPRSFSTEGGFEGVSDRIPAMKALGINTIWFMPVNPGPTTHGYEIVDYFGIEEDYGTEESFKALVEELHENDIRVVIDWVVNHTSIQHRFMQNIFEYGQYSPWADWYLWEGEPGNSNYEFYFDWASLPNLNVANEDVQDYFINAAKYWVTEYNVDGFRCDVAWGVEERSTTYWQKWRKELKNIKPELYLLAEANSENVYYENRFESAYDWQLRNLLIQMMNGNSSINAIDQQVRKSYPVNARPFRFIENHDEARIISTHGVRRALLTQTMIFTLDGIPLLYAGSEAGEQTMRDLINWSDPNGVRPYFMNLIDIRKSYYNNPVLERVTNGNDQEVYSYAVTNQPVPENENGKKNVIVSAVNFSDNTVNTSLDLSGIDLEGSEPYFLTDLFSGEQVQLTSAQLNSVSVQIEYYSARVFSLGDSVTVSLRDYDIHETVTEYGLDQNYPNPFNPTTTIKFAIPEKSNVRLEVYNILGQRVETLIDRELNQGHHEVDFNASRLASGVYFYTIQAGDYVNVKKMMLLK
ncbi:MAG: hypothetical protein SCALA702_29340 [Melioribacteraceae bacterium]|nr:MAG: hypothetical protein SCALA702_29340 [Melioribacteraceae bacterium]